MIESDARQLRDEKRDPRKIVIGCELHSYFGPSFISLAKPESGCKQCWMVWWTHEILKFPPSEREAAMDQAFEAITKCNEAVENGTWNFMPFDRPEVSIEKEAWGK